MLLVIIAAVVLLVLAVDNAYEFSRVYKAYKDKIDVTSAHSRVVEAGELLGFILAGILLYLSALDILAVVVLIVGPWQFFHLVGALTSKQSILKFSQKTLKRFLKVIMAVNFTEVVAAGSFVVWMTSNGWIGL